MSTSKGDAERLACAALGVGRTELFLRRDRPLGAEGARRLDELVARRERREPLAYVLGRWPFLDLDLVVDSRALVPRPETEDVVLEALRLLPEGSEGPVLDVGTGSGCIALALAAARPTLRVVALDRSPRALSLASENADLAGVSDRVALVESDLAAPVAGGAGVAMIVANLPYVARSELAGLEPEVREHEPGDALVSGERGLDAIERLVEAAPRLLAGGGRIVLEIAPARAGAVRDLFDRGGWRDVRILDDRFGRARIATAVLPGASDERGE